MDNKKLIMCGDSFAAGIGCHDLINEPVGSLVAKELGLGIKNLAKGSSTNFSIFLQMEYVVDKLADQAEIVLVGNTSYDRVDWFPLDAEIRGGELTNAMVNYHQYPPYMEFSYHVHGKNVTLPNPMADDPDYTGQMFTDNYMGVIDFWETYGSKKKSSTYYQRFDDEPLSRMKTLYDFATTIHEPRINRIHSIGVLALGHQRLKRAGIKHLIFTKEVDAYAKYIDRENLVNICWGQLSIDYPDDLPTSHTSAEGHRVARDRVLDKLKDNGWI
jgi:hypothetical protein